MLVDISRIHLDIVHEIKRILIDLFYSANTNSATTFNTVDKVCPFTHLIKSFIIQLTIIVSTYIWNYSSCSSKVSFLSIRFRASTCIWNYRLIDIERLYKRQWCLYSTFSTTPRGVDPFGLTTIITR